jgi:hypothetical protein
MSNDNAQEILKDKIKKIDEQIALLTEVKQKCFNKLQVLENLPPVISEQPKPQILAPSIIISRNCTPWR